MNCNEFEEWRNRIELGYDDYQAIQNELTLKECPFCKTKNKFQPDKKHIICGFCDFDFCWLCLLDYKNHREETFVRGAIQPKPVCSDSMDVKEIQCENNEQKHIFEVELANKRKAFYI